MEIDYNNPHKDDASHTFSNWCFACRNSPKVRHTLCFTLAPPFIFTCWLTKISTNFLPAALTTHRSRPHFHASRLLNKPARATLSPTGVFCATTRQRFGAPSTPCPHPIHFHVLTHQKFNKLFVCCTHDTTRHASSSRGLRSKQTPRATLSPTTVFHAATRQRFAHPPPRLHPHSFSCAGSLKVQ